MNVGRRYEHAQAWARMYQVIDDCVRELDPMLPVFQVDRRVLYGIYTTMRKLKEPG
jgi:hypothetical protein